MTKNKTTPPKLATQVLLFFLRDDFVEEVQGDLEEKFLITAKNRSLFRAQLNYWYQVLNYLRPFALRKTRYFYLNSSGMYRNYFKITIRNLVKQKLYSTINIGGLAAGLSCSIIIVLYVQHEFSFDRFYNNSDHIYRVFQKQSGNVFLGSDFFAVTPSQLASVMEEEFPEVVAATSVDDQTALLSTSKNSFWEKGIGGDHHFFDVFRIPFLEGNAKHALKDPKSIILTKSLARKIFPSDDALGQFLKYQNEASYLVTGIIDDPPSNSSFQYSYIINIHSNYWYGENLKRSKWNNNNIHTFFLMAEGADPEKLTSQFPTLIKKYRDPVDYADYPFKDEYEIQPLPSMYMTSGINFDIGLKGNERYVYLFSVVALIVLLLACVNYMNLAVARSINRAREVGLRKVIGAIRSQLVWQFLGESVLIASLSLCLAIGLTYLLLPMFGNVMERPIEFDIFSNTWLLPGLLALVIGVGILSGSYPAVFMSGLRPVEVLKGKIVGKLSSSRLQHGLIILQYAASIALVIGSIVIYQQLQYMKQKELGFDKSGVIVLPVHDYKLRFDNLRNEWLQYPGIEGVTMSTQLPINITSSHIINDESNADNNDDIAIYECRTDADFLKIFNIELIAGRNFTMNKSDSAEAFLINETAARALGWTPEEAIGKQVVDDGKKTIVGVIRDFHMHSMHLPIAPLLLRVATGGPTFVSVKIEKGKEQDCIAMIERSFKKNSPWPFEYHFLDEQFNQLYHSEKKLGEIFGVFTFVSIMIASLGLFGLAAFMTGQRTKEIGIRKVLGASAQQIVLLLSKDFLMLVTIAFVLAIPLGWFGMNAWLQDFAYRIDIEWWIFAIAGLTALSIAKLTISYQSIRASTANPVESLKDQ
jgi:putative ABC transport system permease protein